MGKEIFEGGVVIISCSKCLQDENSSPPWDGITKTFLQHAKRLKELHLGDYPDHVVVIDRNDQNK